MRQISKDQNGNDWDIRWGVLDEQAAHQEYFHVSGPFQRTGEFASFPDPTHRNETKTLSVYENAEGKIVAMAEITPSIYAAGVKL